MSSRRQEQHKVIKLQKTSVACYKENHHMWTEILSIDTMICHKDRRKRDMSDEIRELVL